jgi:pyocin large subunit-like protein
VGQGTVTSTPADATAPAARTPARGDRAAPAGTAACDFRDEPKLLDHHARHGADFESRTPADYLATACRLRDAPLSQDVLELRRKDGVLCRFRRSDGAFLAYRADGTILTCFKPERGERYFRDQLERDER